MKITDIVMCVTLALTIVILFLTILLSKRKRLVSTDDDMIKLANKLRNNWLGSSIAFLIAQYWCVLISILSTLVVLYLGCFEDTTLVEIKARLILYSALSLFATICPYVVNFSKWSKKYRSAFYELEKQLLSSNDLGKAIAEGERIINQAFDE